tara:strand:- start:2859 stop:3917 length:1059 start_codon:yes stop_codon:yes gene_type:complete
MVSTNLDNLNNIPHIENTFPKLLLKHAKDRASHPAFRQKRLGIWQTLSWQQTKDTTESLSLGLSNLGLKRADKIAVIGQNTTMMYLSMLATQSLGGVIVPIFPDASAEEFQSLLAHAEIKAVICQDQEQIDKIEIVKKNIKSLEFLIYEQPRGMRSYNQNYIHSIDELIQAGGSVKGNGKSYFENEIMSGDGDDLSTIIYTPGAGTKLHAEIKKHVYDKGLGSGDLDRIGEVLYIRGMLNHLFVVEAIRNAQKHFNVKVPNGDQMQWGYENMNVNAADWERIGLPGFPPISVSCNDHEGNHPVLFQQWDAGSKSWKVVSDWIPVMKDLVRPLQEADAAKFAKENNITPKSCS